MYPTKFKAFNKEKKSIGKPLEIEDIAGLGLIRRDNLVFLHFTEKCDINNSEIYELDILKYPSYGIWFVEYDRNSSALMLFRKDKKDGIPFENYEWHEKPLVIGNLLTTPERLVEE